tara:strand:+ start:1182 stop:1340 length:159 start_codon:yes stop_codon:yes gene_type:complete
MERLKPGRKPINEKDKVKMCSAYLKLSEKQAIINKYQSLTKAVKLLIIPTLN